MKDNPNNEALLSRVIQRLCLDPHPKEEGLVQNFMDQLKSQPNTLLFLLDGYDELSKNIQNSDFMKYLLTTNKKIIDDQLFVLAFSKLACWDRLSISKKRMLKGIFD